MKSTSILVFLMTLFTLISCEKELTKKDFKLTEEPIEFVHENYTLKGVITKPEGKSTYPLIIFVHGDGAMDRYQKGYNKYFFKQLNNQGFACMSWDKQGVGESTGNWLNQSMTNRAEEVLSAIKMIQSKSEIENISLLGFSQGCWVIPKTYHLAPNNITSLIFSSPAVNWLRQGEFHLKTRLKKKKFSTAQIQQCLDYSEAGNVFLDQNNYEGYKSFYNNQSEFIKKQFSLMNEERWGFVVKNYMSDITDDLDNIECPTLGLFGLKDENVDAQESTSIFQNIFMQNGNLNYEGHTFQNADHHLFDINHKGKKNTEDDVWYKLLYKGKNVFSPELFEIIIEFL